MESTFLSIKFVIFMGWMVTVVTMLGAVLVAAAYQVVRDKLGRSRRPAPTAPRESTSHS